MENGYKLTGKKILIVDDSRQTRVVLTMILTAEGAQIIEAEDSISALKMLEDSVPDLIIMDIHMPGMDGVTAAKIIKNCEKMDGTPILVVSADHDAYARFPHSLKRLDAFLPKPFTKNELLAKASQLIS